MCRLLPRDLAIAILLLTLLTLLTLLPTLLATLLLRGGGGGGARLLVLLSRGRSTRSGRSCGIESASSTTSEIITMTKSTWFQVLLM